MSFHSSSITQTRSRNERNKAHATRTKQNGLFREHLAAALASVRHFPLTSKRNSIIIFTMNRVMPLFGFYYYFRSSHPGIFLL